MAESSARAAYFFIGAAAAVAVVLSILHFWPKVESKKDVSVTLPVEVAKTNTTSQLSGGNRVSQETHNVAGQGPASTPATAQSIEAVRMAAEKGDPKAQFDLGGRYFLGNGLDGEGQDFTEAVKWFRKAAEQGLPGAQGNLAFCYKNGLGVKTDRQEAVKWYRMAAEQGDALGQYSLGLCYFEGSGVDTDPAEAIKWYRKAAEQGDAQAQCNLGSCYAEGTGIEQDWKEAVKWYRKAAEHGDGAAQCNLAKCYRKGEGVGKDEQEAFKWYLKAAERRVPVAQFNVGACYYNGIGVAQDKAEAIKWFRMASDQGYPDAINVLMTISPSSIESGTAPTATTITNADPKPTRQPPVTQPANALSEEEAWHGVNCFDTGSLENFLKVFPSGRNAADAKEALEVLGLLRKVAVHSFSE